MSFTRASVRRELDYSGLFVELLSGEVGFRGGRRVRNLLTQTETFGAAWANSISGTGVAPVKTPNYGGVAAPDGSFTACRMQFDLGGSVTDAGNISFIVENTHSAVSGSTYARSVWLRTTDGSSKTVALKLNNYQSSLDAVAIDGTWRRYSLATTSGVGPNIFGIGLRGSVVATCSASADVLVWHPQLEDVTGQSNQNPSEYVSVGVLSSPYHGAMVDGVKWFTRENPNIVVGNVVQEITGVAVPEIPYPQVLKGYTPMPAATNLLTYSGDLTNAAWTKAASVASIATYPPRLLKESLPSQLRDDSTAASIHGMFRNPTVTANTNYCAWLVVHSSGQRYRGRIGFLDAATSSNGVICEFNARTGVTNAAAVGTGTLAGSGYINVAKGWGIVYVSGKIDAATTAAQVQFLIADSAGNLVYDGDGVSRMILGHFQLETGTVPTNIIPTTSAAVTVAADVLSLTMATPAALAVSYFNEVVTGANQSLLSANDGTGNEREYLIHNGANYTIFVTDGGVVQASGTIASAVAGAFANVAARFALNDISGIVNGGTVVADTSGTLPTTTTLNIGHHLGSAFAQNPISYIRAWDTPLTDAEFKAITANGYADQKINTLGWVDSPQISHDGRRLYFMYSRYDFAPLLIDGAGLVDLSITGGERSWHVAIPHPSYDADVYCAYLRHDGTVERIENMRFDPNYDDFSLQVASAESSIMEVAATASLPKRIYYNANRDGDVPKLVYRQESAAGSWTVESTSELATVSGGGSGAGYIDDNAFVSDSRLELVFASTRPGGQGSSDLWRSTRAGPTDLWGAPTNIGTNINTAGHEDQVFLHPNGTDCWFTRDGGIYHCTRAGATFNNDDTLVTFTGTPLSGGIGEPSTDEAMNYLYFSYLELATRRICIMRAPWTGSKTAWGTPVAID